MSGVLNVYVPAFANLGASLGRDGHLPRFFARGSRTGRGAASLAGPGRRAITLAYTAIFFAFHLDLQTFILIHTSSMVAVYALGMIAALRLLRRWSLGWWMAVVSTVLIAGLLVLAGAHLLVPAILALAAVAVTVIRRIRARRTSVNTSTSTT